MVRGITAGLLIWLFSLQTGAQPAGQLAIIIDDVGYNRALGERAARLPGAYTLALLPGTPHSHHLAQLAREHDKELMLHAPMANTAGLALGAGALELGMERRAFMAVLRQSLDALPDAVGINNHMGSALTPLAVPMGWVMGEAARRELYFIDSRTTAASRAHAVAQAYGVPSAKRDVFLDHSRDRAHILRQLQRAVALARQRGRAIAIGHPYPETLTVLESAGDTLAAITLVPASRLAASPPPGRYACHAPPPLLRRSLAANTAPAAPKGEKNRLNLIENSYQIHLPVVKDDINNPG